MFYGRGQKDIHPTLGISSSGQHPNNRWYQSCHGLIFPIVQATLPGKAEDHPLLSRPTTPSVFDANNLRYYRVEPTTAPTGFFHDLSHNVFPEKLKAFAKDDHRRFQKHKQNFQISLEIGFELELQHF